MLASLTNRLEALDEKARGWIIGVGRISLGLLWLANLHWKVPPGFGSDTGGGLYKYSASVSRHSPFGPFTWITEEIILPNFRFFGWVTLLSEIALAALLIIGYRTKIVALAGAAFTVPIMLSVLYYDKADEWSWSYLLMIAAHLLAYGADAGAHLGVDGVMRRDGAAAQRALRVIAMASIAVGACGLFVARSVSFAGSKVALLGSDSGFIDDTGKLVRRWELKFLWFNSLWALLTIAFGVMLLVGARQVMARKAGIAGFGVMAVVMLAVQHFDYVRSDGTTQSVSTGSNVAVWSAIAIAAFLLDRRANPKLAISTPD